MAASLLDSNIWVAATFSSHPFHEACAGILREATVGEPLLFCRATELSFVRLISSPGIIAHYGAEGMTNRLALAVLEALRARPAIRFGEEPTGTGGLWRRIASRDDASPKVWMDAYLAAFAIAGRFTLVSLDRDFEDYRRHGLDLRLIRS